MLKRIVTIGAAAFLTFGLLLYLSGESQKLGRASDEGPELPDVERLRPVGLTGVVHRVRREGALLVDLRPKNSGRQIAGAIHAAPQDLPRLIRAHFAKAEIKNKVAKRGRRFVIVIGDESEVAAADRVLEKREGFDVLRYLPAWFVERRVTKFLDTDVPQMSVAQLRREQQRGGLTIIDIQLEDEYSHARLARSIHIAPYEEIFKGDFSRLPPRGKTIAVY